MAFTVSRKPALTATALLALDAAQLAQYVEEDDDADSGFVISGLDFVEDLSSSQQDEVEEKFR